MIYCFGGFQLDTRLLELRREGAPVPIVPRAFDLLRLLIERRDRLVGKNELIGTVWRGRVVSDATVSSCVNAARRAIGDDGRRQEMIRTAPALIRRLPPASRAPRETLSKSHRGTTPRPSPSFHSQASTTIQALRILPTASRGMS
jgi:hypothetical protein